MGWLCGPEPSAHAMHAGRFVLAVWDPYIDWVERYGQVSLVKFDIIAAFQVWDRAHGEAVQHWFDTRNLSQACY